MVERLTSTNLSAGACGASAYLSNMMSDVAERGVEVHTEMVLRTNPDPETWHQAVGAFATTTDYIYPHILGLTLAGVAGVAAVTTLYLTGLEVVDYYNRQKGD